MITTYPTGQWHLGKPSVTLPEDGSLTAQIDLSGEGNYRIRAPDSASNCDVSSTDGVASPFTPKGEVDNTPPAPSMRSSNYTSSSLPF